MRKALTTEDTEGHRGEKGRNKTSDVWLLFLPEFLCETLCPQWFRFSSRQRPSVVRYFLHGFIKIISLRQDFVFEQWLVCDKRIHGGDSLHGRIEIVEQL